MIRVETTAHRVVVSCSRHAGWSVSLGSYSVELPVVLRAAINHVSAEHGAYPRPLAWRSGGDLAAAMRPSWAAPQDVYPIVTTAHAELDDEPPADYGVDSTSCPDPMCGEPWSAHP
jgi:hypothetical protein